MPYLMDDIKKIAAAVRAQGAVHDPVLGIYPDIADRLQLAPRYLLDNATIHASVELTLGRPKILLEALNHLQVPYRALWCEWEEAGRHKLRETFDYGPEDPFRPLPTRLGFLIETAPGGRAGQVTWVWSGKDHDFPNIAPISAFFDLDQRIKQPPERILAFLRGNLAQLWEDNRTQLEALLEIWRTAEHRPSEHGARYLKATEKLGNNRELMLQHFYGDVYGEYIDVWGILLLLTASRPTVAYAPVDRTKLNKARVKRQEVPLLDHTNVTMKLADHTVRGQMRDPLNHARKSPRIHLVSRYLARRNDKHWIVEPYVRGSGEPVPRYVKVTR